MNKKLISLSRAVVLVVITAVFLFPQDSGADSAGVEYVSTNVVGLIAAKPAETLELQDGSTYDITAGYVKKNIGGIEHRMLAYNGSIPGPLIKVKQGARIAINFKNNTDMKSLLHVHGVRIENAFDGTHIVQKEMEPGESFRYKLTFQDAGIYWYHPHVREDFGQELGLYGNFLVEPANADYWSPVNREVPLLLDDILIEGGIIALNKGRVNHTLMGRFGNTMLVNGEKDYALSVQKGEVVRFYITSAASVRPFNFAIEGLKLKRVGADGGAYERDEWVSAVLLSPSERVIVEVMFDTGGTFAIQNKTPDKIYTLGKITVGSEQVAVSYATTFAELRTSNETMQSIDPLRQYFDRLPDKTLQLSLDMSSGMMHTHGMGHEDHIMPDDAKMGGSMTVPGRGGIEWEDTNQMMSQMFDADAVLWKMIDKKTNKENMDIDWSFTRGKPVKIRIFNDPSSMHPMQHPIHFHGQRLLVLSRDGEKETNLVWKDTVSISAGETVDILLDTSNPGTWMAHCHIAEHLGAGMVMKFTVNQSEN